MKLTVKNHIEDTHELDCECENGTQIVVDPFVGCAIECNEFNYKEIGRSLVGRFFEMDKFKIFNDGVYLPWIFVEIFPTR